MQSNPEHVLVFTNLATLLSGLKQYAEAEAVARQAMKLHEYSFKAIGRIALRVINGHS